MPQLSTDGCLYFIRRPYRDPNQPPTPPRAALDLVLLPFRLFYAVFQFLNFFKIRYTGHTLTTTGQARQKHADIRKMMIWGNLLDADKAAGRAEDGIRALVPKSWELVRRKDEREEVVAKGVLCYDLYFDGSVSVLEWQRNLPRRPERFSAPCPRRSPRASRSRRIMRLRKILMDSTSRRMCT